MERKTLPFTLKQEPGSLLSGVVEGYAAVFGNVLADVFENLSLPCSKISHCRDFLDMYIYTSPGMFL